MIKVKGNLEKALAELKADKNNSVSHVYEEFNNIVGPLSDAVITIKDLFATKDAKTQSSSKILKDFTPGYDATIVDKLRKSGAKIPAKTHMDELALGGTGLLSAYGPIVNPLDSERRVGGSSSGAAATLTDNITAAIGSDTGDSVRLPASYVGKVGFKPSYGAVSRYGAFPLASSLDTVGWFTHNVADAIEISKVLFGKDEKDMTSKEVEVPTQESKKPNKIAIIKNTRTQINEVVNQKMDELIAKLEKEGIIVEEVEMDQQLLDLIAFVYRIISSGEALSNNANLTGISFGNRIDGSNWDTIMTNTRTQFGSEVQRRFALGAYFLDGKHSHEIYLKAQKVRRLIVNAFNEVYKKYDMIMYPSSNIANKVDAETRWNWYDSILTHSNLEGTPSLSIPFMKLEGMPINLSIDSKIYDDKNVMSYGLYLENILGGNNE